MVKHNVSEFLVLSAQTTAISKSQLVLFMVLVTFKPNEPIAWRTHGSSYVNSNIDVFTKCDKITIHKLAPLLARGFFG